ncbi:glucokinase [Dictyobacter sp. S3.2.2.5]|uniref:Glucokinase n=1 Tax=Dictyobacter halimunensis TaxID=3026934 RepID=A0ABQ6FK43_9CHLR|nr:glucokinase [Dictyobacter sp. S3.2.2.5]
MDIQTSVVAHDPGSLVIGVDVGGTKIAAGVVDALGQVYGRVQFSTDTSRPEATLRTVAHAVRSAIQAAGVSPAHIRGVGLGIPGKVDVENGVSVFAVNLGWRDVPIKRQLEADLAVPCRVENDVNAAALGEYLYGVGRGTANLVYLILGTGIAARVMISGQLYRGTNGLAGEIGHAIFVADGPPCRCGAQGCLEALAAGPALARSARDAVASGSPSSLQEVLNRGSELTAEHVCQAASQGDGLAMRIITEAGEHIAHAIYLLSLSFDPQVVVLGGGLAQVEILMDAVQARVARKAEQSPIFRDIYHAQLVRLTGLKQDAGILGAAALVASPETI